VALFDSGCCSRSIPSDIAIAYACGCCSIPSGGCCSIPSDIAIAYACGCCSIPSDIAIAYFFNFLLVA
jgi:hypothetical protein